jgi:hypothetical protein
MIASAVPRDKRTQNLPCHQIRLEARFISLKQGVMFSRLNKAWWNLTPMVRVLENF